MSRKSIKDVKRGASVSTRDMCKAAVDGRLLKIRLIDGHELCGYLAGMDDYHWKVVTPKLEVSLVHKAAAAVIVINGPTLAEESRREAIEAIIRPFQGFASGLLGRQPPEQGDSSS